jgi:hypothetical protein
MRIHRAVAVLSLALASSSCATLQQIAALRDVDFSVDRLSGVRLAGVDLARVRSYSQLSVTEAARLATAVSQRTLPTLLGMLLYGMVLALERLLVVKDARLE